MVQYNDIAHIIVGPEAENQRLKFTKDTPYLALWGEQCDVFCEYLAENWPPYNGTALYCTHTHIYIQLYKTDAHVCTEIWVLIALNSSGLTINYWIFVDLRLQAGHRRPAPFNREGVVELQQHWPNDRAWQLTEYKLSHMQHPTRSQIPLLPHTGNYDFGS